MGINSFGDYIKQLREKLGYTQNILSDKIGVTSKVISNWESGISFPKNHIIFQLANALNVTVENLISKIDGGDYINEH